MVYVASWFWAGDEVASAAAKPWPNGLGSVATVPDRYPPHPENEAARKLTVLAGAVAESEAVTTYVRQEIARGELTIAEPPSIPNVVAIRDLLLREPIVWERNIALQHGGLLGKVRMYQSLTRALLASALARARQNDAAAWEDLHAAWNLTKSLDEQPPLIVRIVAMSMTRAINGVAWKLPLPSPAWFAEVRQRDFMRPLFATLQYESWARASFFKVPLKPFADATDRERAITGDLAQMTKCEFRPEPATRVDPDVGDMSDLDITWQRAFRYRAEREATANALRARAGHPIEKRSQCSDGTWSFDGKTLRFAIPIALPEKIDTSMPLTLRLRE
jgi:hypothetical protein